MRTLGPRYRGHDQGAYACKVIGVISGRTCVSSLGS